jgi:hypothetical protein
MISSFPHFVNTPSATISSIQLLLFPLENFLMTAPIPVQPVTEYQTDSGDLIYFSYPCGKRFDPNDPHHRNCEECNP